jgi:drug/metabolite transporter (DMT)-like permease
MLPVLFGLSSALSWGAADFCGGLASRKGKAYQVVLFGEAVGLAFLVVAAWLSGEKPLPWTSLLMCTVAGSMGVLGLLLFFKSMTAGKMSVAAPVSALTAALLPVIVGSILDGFPGGRTFAGFGLALVAIWFISQPDGGEKNIRVRLADLSLPLIAGLSFGVYLILYNRGSQTNLFLPLVASRLAGTVTMLLFVLFMRQPLLPGRAVWPLITLNGILDVTGNGLYILAGQAGRMDVAAVLVSLYPGSTVLLAGLILHERLNRAQVVGVLAALAAIVLMTI